MDNKKPARWRKMEMILALFFSVVSLVGSFIYSEHRQEIISSKILALKNQLSALRVGVLLYRANHRKNPASLQEMFAATFDWGDGPRRYVDLNWQEGQELKDPFGKPYHYDSVSGWVRSTTKEFEVW